MQVKTHAQMVLKKIDAGEDVFATLHDDNEGLRSLSTVKKAQQNSFNPMKLQEEVSAHDVMISHWDGLAWEEARLRRCY
mgnify:CR=1 FL=1